jgi:hypothetical protein
MIIVRIKWHTLNQVIDALIANIVKYGQQITRKQAANYIQVTKVFIQTDQFQQNVLIK